MTVQTSVCSAPASYMPAGLTAHAALKRLCMVQLDCFFKIPTQAMLLVLLLLLQWLPGKF